MGSLSVWHWVILLAVVFMLFGGGKLSSIMGDAAKGIKEFKNGLRDDELATMPAEQESRDKV